MGAQPISFRTDDGRTLAYEERGTGPTVVLLPGGPGLDPHAFFEGADLPGFRQVLLHPRGTGASDRPSSPDGYRIAGYVDDLEALRVHLGLERLTLYGSSHGASVALAYAAGRPERVERMVIADGPARFDARYADALGTARARFGERAADGAARAAASEAALVAMRTETDDAARHERLRTTVDYYVARPDERTTGYLDRLAAAPTDFVAPGPMAAEMMSGLDLLSGAGAITAPVLVLAGELDARVPVEHMEDIAAALPGARLHRFPDCGHLPHVELPDPWAETVAAFLRE